MRAHRRPQDLTRAKRTVKASSSLGPQPNVDFYRLLPGAACCCVIEHPSVAETFATIPFN